MISQPTHTHPKSCGTHVHDSPDPGVPTAFVVPVQCVRVYSGSHCSACHGLQPGCLIVDSTACHHPLPVPAGLPIYLGPYNGNDSKAGSPGAAIDWILARRDVRVRFEGRKYGGGRHEWDRVRFLGNLPA